MIHPDRILVLILPVPTLPRGWLQARVRREALTFLSLPVVWGLAIAEDVYRLIEAVVGRLRDSADDVLQAACQVCLPSPRVFFLRPLSTSTGGSEVIGHPARRARPACLCPRFTSVHLSVSS